MPNPTNIYPDFIINDISSSYKEQNNFMSGDKTVGSIPVLFTIDGPLSLKGTNLPYTVTVSKTKDI